MSETTKQIARAGFSSAQSTYIVKHLRLDYNNMCKSPCIGLRSSYLRDLCPSSTWLDWYNNKKMNKSIVDMTIQKKKKKIHIVDVVFSLNGAKVMRNQHNTNCKRPFRNEE